MAFKYNEHLYWIGTDNPASRDFHGIASPRGGSYNSYLILDDQPTIVDTTNVEFIDCYIESLKSVIDPIKVVYLIVTHLEPDHSGGLAAILSYCKNAKVICTQKAKDMMYDEYDLKPDCIVVADGASISTGKFTFEFYHDPMVHWPETMFAYLKQEKALFSSDLFGTEISHESHYADEMQPYSEHTRDYYALIMRPVYINVKKAIDKVKVLDIKSIYPAHGPAYRKNPTEIISYYEKLTVDPEEKGKVLVVYYSVWHSSEKIANIIASSLKAKGFNPVLCNINDANYVSMMGHALTSKAIIFGSLTINGTYHPAFDALFGFLRINYQKGKKVFLFSTYGWQEASIVRMNLRMQELGYEVMQTEAFKFGAKSEDDIKRLSGLISRVTEVL